MFHHDGYVNLLQHGEDFRRLAEDTLMRRCALVPRGQEVKPGVWVGKRARIHPDAIVEGAVFIGEDSKIGANAVLTGCSTIEHHSHVDHRTTLDDSTVLPYSYVGKNLNVLQSVVGFSQVAQVDRNVTVSIADAKLIRAISPSSVTRTLEPVRSALSRVRERISEEFKQPEPAEFAKALTMREEVAEAAPQKARAAAATGSAGVKLKKHAN
jgi:NDP-sugar pyrophosphorylase family protein